MNTPEPSSISPPPQGTPPSNRRAKIWSVVASLAVTVIILAWVMRDVHPKDVLRALLDMNRTGLLLFLVSSFF